MAIIFNNKKRKAMKKLKSQLKKLKKQLKKLIKSKKVKKAAKLKLKINLVIFYL